MKAYKFEIVCFDPNGDCGLEDILYRLESQKYFCTQILNYKSTEIGKWEDDHPLNCKLTSEEYIEAAIWELEGLV